MSRAPRIDIANYQYHVLNRSNGRTPIFNTPADYQLFIDILEETVELLDMRLLAYCLMPNHWHLLLEPKVDGDLSRFMSRLTNTHVKQYQSKYSLVGMGHLYQGRYKAFLIENGHYFYTVLRYVERNAVRAKLCSRAEVWTWGSAFLRANGKTKILSPLPIDIPSSYIDDLNLPLSASEQEAVKQSEICSIPFASEAWQENMKVVIEQKSNPN